jgi:hypothetical protein
LLRLQVLGLTHTSECFTQSQANLTGCPRPVSTQDPAVPYQIDTGTLNAAATDGVRAAANTLLPWEPAITCTNALLTR